MHNYKHATLTIPENIQQRSIFYLNKHDKSLQSFGEVHVNHFVLFHYMLYIIDAISLH